MNTDFENNLKFDKYLLSAIATSIFIYHFHVAFLFAKIHVFHEYYYVDISITNFLKRWIFISKLATLHVSENYVLFVLCFVTTDMGLLQLFHTNTSILGQIQTSSTFGWWLLWRESWSYWWGSADFSMRCQPFGSLDL